LDHDGYLSSFAVVTGAKQSELKVARGLRLEAGTILAVADQVEAALKSRTALMP